MRTNVWTMVMLVVVGMNGLEVWAAGNLDPAEAAWTIPYGQEFWRQAQPVTKTMEVNGQESAAALAKSGINIGDVMERVSCSFRADTESKALMAQGQTYRAIYEGNGIAFSPFLPAKSNGVEEVSKEATCPRGTPRSMKRDTVRKCFSRGGAETQSRRDAVRSECFLRDPCAFARDDLLLSEQSPEAQLEKRHRERPDSATRPSSDPETVARFHTVRVSVGDTILYDAASVLAKAEESTLGNTIQRLLNAEAGLVEHWQTRREGMEVAWILQKPPVGDGPLVIEVEAEGLNLVGATANAAHYGNGGVGRVRMSEATAVDATGKRCELAMKTDGGRIVYELPETFLALVTYPLAVDPIISAEFGMDKPVYVPATGDQWDPSIAWNGTYFLVVWEDNLNGYHDYDIYGTRVNSTGYVLDPAGIPISTATQDQSAPSVAWDGTNFLVVWEDYRNGLSSDIYGTRVSSTGNVLDSLGIAISSAFDYLQDPSVAWNGSNFLVVWSGHGPEGYDIRGTRVSSAGTVLDPPGGINISRSHKGYDPALAWNGSHFLVVWQSGTDTDSNIMGARVSSTCVVLDYIAISTAANEQLEPSVAWDGSNFLIVWQDYRSWPCDIYGARVNSAGSVLDPYGIAISTAANAQWNPSLAWNGNCFLVVWEDYRSGPVCDVYGARVNSAGTVLDSSGIAISTAAEAQANPAIAWNGSEFLVVWYDRRSETRYSDIYGTWVSATGTVLDPTGVIISTESANSQYWPSVAWNGNHYLVVWSDSRNGLWDIYGVRVNSSGAVLDPSGIAISTAANDQEYPSVGWDGNLFLVVWDDSRSGSSDDVYGARVSSIGAVLDPTGIAISTAAGSQVYPVITWNGSHFLVVWADGRNGLGLDIYGARVNSTGTILDPTGIAISTAANYQNFPSLAWNGNQFLVVWMDYRREISGDIYGARVSSAGGVFDPSGIAISTAASNQILPSVASDGSQFLVVWQDYRSGSSWDIYGARVNSAGVVLDPSGITISTTAYDQWGTSVAWTGSRFLVVWGSYCYGSGWDIYGARINSAGIVLDPAGIAVNSNMGYQENPTVAAGSNGQSLVAYIGGIGGIFYRILGMLFQDDSTVTVSATDPTAGEPGTGQGSGTFRFTRTAPLTAALTVNFTVGGTATAGSDYTSLGTTVRFAAGATSTTKTVNVINDSLVESDETVRLTLASGAGYMVGSPSNATVTIKDDDTVPGVIVDNADATGVTIVGTWTRSTSSTGYWRTNYLHDGNTGKGSKSVTFRPTLPSAGNYEVSVWYTAGSNRATNVPMDIVYSGGTRTVQVNERVNGSKWVILGTNSFAAGTTGYVRIRTTGTSSGYVIADAVRFRPVAVTQVIVDNADTTGVTLVGTWTGSTSSTGYWRTNYLHDGNTGKGSKSVTFRPTLPSAGNYEVSVWYTAGSNRATNVSVDIVYSGGSRVVLVNERVNGSQWVVLGTNSFTAGTTGYVRIRTTGTSSGYVIADAVRFKHL